MERGIVPMAWDTNSTGTNQMTIVNRKDLTIYNPYMMDGIHEAMEAVGIPVTAVPTVSSNKTDTDARTYDLSGRLVTDRPATELSKGIFIRNGKKLLVH
jgi:hypothetical protein